tara:strand:+ start:7913 stop:8044 length:132 start_codon:yes stop_codon:yes gene_type:complete
MKGKLIEEFEANSKIDLSNFPKGIYLIKLVLEKGILTDKIIID